MRVVLLDTNVVSILFKPDHSLYQKCFAIVSGHQWFISFMTRGELLLWPRLNQWGSKRRDDLKSHVDLCTTLFPDEDTCVVWADIIAESRIAGRPIEPMLGLPLQPGSGTSRLLLRTIVTLNISTASH